MSQPKQFGAGRLWLFKLTSVLLPLAALCLIEITLRLFHYGHDLSLFMEYPQDRRFLVLNPDASKKYFTNQRIATTGNIELFKEEKDSNTLRIFVLGESTTIGYPYFHNGSFHRWLQYRLAHTFPDRNLEIVNIALTAVNSYTVLGFAKEMVDYQPDVVLIYAGHNEYYGALGVGSTESIAGSPFIVNLILDIRKLRFVQLMTSLYEKIRYAPETNQGEEVGTRMKLMVADQQIPYQSELYKRGVEQFRSNMNETLDLLNKHHIPVFVSNLVSNEKDLKPFVSFPVDSIQFPGFTVNYNRGIRALKDNHIQAAYSYLKSANHVYNANANCNYYLGKLAYTTGDFEQAKEYFSKARDMDGLRFRAPEELNTILVKLCARYSNAHLVDTKAAFEAHSIHGIIGNGLILEHVHPNLSGYALMSDAFYNSLKKEKLVAPALGTELTFDQLLKHMPITKADSLAGSYKVSNLKRSWPFKEALGADTFRIQSFEEQTAYKLANRKISWANAMDSLYTYYINNHELTKARTIVETLTLEYPTDAQYYLKSAMLSGELKDEESALFYFKKAFGLTPSFDIARYLFVIYLKLDKPGKAAPYLDYAIENNTSRFNLNALRSYNQQIIELQKAYVADSGDVSVLIQIANLYAKMDNKEGGSKYARKILKIDARNQDAKVLLSRLEGR
jgi:lysophospholipase L1-like esterase